MNIPQRIVLVSTALAASAAFLFENRMPSYVTMPICILAVGIAVVVAIRPR